MRYVRVTPPPDLRVYTIQTRSGRLMLLPSFQGQGKMAAGSSGPGVVRRRKCRMGHMDFYQNKLFLSQKVFIEVFADKGYRTSREGGEETAVLYGRYSQERANSMKQLDTRVTIIIINTLNRELCQSWHPWVVLG
ncbi:hypothetical protein FKM82_022104 [Ascaphus truei]